MRRSTLLAPVVALILTITAIAAVWLLVGQASSSRGAQLQVSSLTLSLSELGIVPFTADPASGGSPSASQAQITADERSIALGLMAHSQTGVPPSLLSAGRADLAALEPVVASIYRISVSQGGLAHGGARVPTLTGIVTVRSAALSAVLTKINRADDANATSSELRTKLGAAGAMLLLLAAFAFFYFRSVAAHRAVERLGREKEALLGISRDEARTDALTNLGNRRALTLDLASAIAEPPGSSELLLGMFDLDGFKQYNDTFGHAAGDSLLQRLGGRLAGTVRQAGSAYRMGGDEFCVLARCRPDGGKTLLAAATEALEDGGEGWRVGCSHGAAWIPSEATTESRALKLADERMYMEKSRRSSTSRSGSSASRQVTDALLQVITEQDAFLDDHVERVADLAGAVATALGQPAHEIRRIILAAKLHDVGKTAIPAAILDKPGPLDEREWKFMRRHPLIGERIVMAAPALANTAGLIRSSHERIDGQGYPDGLAGDQIPLGSRIIAVCDAYDAMTSDRPYRESISTDAALQELRRCAGPQFDANVVATFCAELTREQASALEPQRSTVGV
jgi:diguanylate cyclase (GGDEF)-like protein